MYPSVDSKNLEADRNPPFSSFLHQGPPSRSKAEPTHLAPSLLAPSLSLPPYALGRNPSDLTASSLSSFSIPELLNPLICILSSFRTDQPPFLVSFLLIRIPDPTFRPTVSVPQSSRRFPRLLVLGSWWWARAIALPTPLDRRT